MADNDLDAPLGHADMAQDLVKKFGETIRWVPDLRGGEFVYFNERWHGEPGCHAHVVGMLGNRIIELAGGLKLPPKQHKAMTSVAFRRGSISTVIDLNTDLHAPLEQWDVEPAALQTPSGVFDLEADPGTAGSPADARCLMLHCTETRADPEVKCPLFMGVLESMFAPSPQDLAYFKDRIGAGMFGHNGEQKVNWLTGPPGAGKTTAMTAIMLVLGSYGWVGNAGLVVRPAKSFGTSMQAEGFHKAALARARVVLLDEAPASGVLIAPVFKQLANGGLMQVEEKKVQPHVARMKVTCFLLTNKLVEGGLDGEDGRSLRRRIALICADGRAPDVLVDRLAEKIAEDEGPGVLWWLIEQARAWHERRGVLGSGPVEMSQQARETVEGFTAEGDPEIEWLAQRVDQTGDLKDETSSQALWDDFVLWWSSQKSVTHAPMSEVNFYRQIRVAIDRAGKGARYGKIPKDPAKPSGDQLRGYRGLLLKPVEVQDR